MGALLVQGIGSTWGLGQSTWVERGGMVWHGNFSQWQWEEESDHPARWRLNASTPGTHRLWGCPTSLDSHSTAAFWHWTQNTAGSASNRSSWRWVSAPTLSPEESAQLLYNWDEAGWLDESMGFAAGSQGSEDPLTCWMPQHGPWELLGTCLPWDQPFAYDGAFTIDESQRWILEAHDHNLRSQRWIDTLSAGSTNQSLCVGFQVECTSSHVQDWAFTWHPVAFKDAQAITDPWPGLSPRKHKAQLLDSATLILTSWPPPHETPHARRLGKHSASLPLHRQECDNVWTASLSPSLRPGSKTELNVNDDTLWVWSDGSSQLQAGGLAFTEIMADPTPATHAPPTTYLEVLNLSLWVLNPTSLCLLDNGTCYELEVPQEMAPAWLPGERIILCDDAETFCQDSSFGNQSLVVEVKQWPGLRDDGETVSLMLDDRAIESVSYARSWWKGMDQGGRALSILNARGCDHESNWFPDPQGASLFEPSLTELDASDEELSTQLLLFPNPEGFIELHPQPAWDDRQPTPYLALDSQGHLSEGVLISMQDAEGNQWWELPPPSVPSGVSQALRLTLSEVAFCLNPERTMTVDTSWTRYRLAQPGDIIATELLTRDHAFVEAEFIEWTNASGDTLDWHGMPWPPGACLVQSNQGLDQFRQWLGDDWFDGIHSALWEANPSLWLTNAQGRVILLDQWGKAISAVDYSDCGYSCPDDVTSGKSMELVEGMPFTKWETCRAKWGISPGMSLCKGFEPRHNFEAARLTHGILDGRWCFRPGGEIPAEALQHNNWEPETHWSWVWHQGMLVAQADWGPDDDSSSQTPNHLQCDWLSFPDGLAQASHTPAIACTEWLQSPNECHGPFVEFLVEGEGTTTTDWRWTTRDNPAPNDFDLVTQATWWLPSGLPTCLATCPNWVEHGSSSCLPANLPSLHGDRTMTFVTPDLELEIPINEDMHSPWVQHTNGHSMTHNLHHDVWTTTPEHLQSTPGVHDQADNETSNGAKRGVLTCTPQTLQPGALSQLDWIQAKWLPEEPDALFNLKWSVRRWNNPANLVASHAYSVQGEERWIWRGQDQLGAMQPSGQYIVQLAWEGLDRGQRGVARCLVTISPP